MPSQIKVDQIAGASGNTVTVPSGQTLDISSATLSLPSTIVTTTGTQTLTNKTIGVSQLTGTLPVANGGTGLTTLGSASQVLRVNSGATALEFGSVSSDFVKLATTTVSSNTASVSIDGYFDDATYNYYILSIRGLRIDDNNGNYPNMRFNVGGSADTTAGAYYTMQQQNYSQSAANGVNVRNTFNNSFFQMNTTWSVEYQTHSQITSNYEIKIYNPSSSSLYKWINFTSALCNDNTPTYMIMDNGVGMFKRTNVVTGITWLNEDGSNTSAGTFTLYGVKK
jgi:hypothetical protein